jgi:Ca-activated chloride channel family protein
MMFLHPGFLWLLLVLVPLLVLHVRQRTSSGLRAVLVTVTRLAAVALVCGALARPILERGETARAVVAVVDVSASVTDEALDAAVSSVTELAAGCSREQPLRLVLVDSVAREATLDELRAVRGVRRRLGSDIAAGLQLAAALLAEKGTGEVHLYTDGDETAGDAEAAAYRLAQLGIPVRVHSLARPRSPEVILRHVSLPAQSARGATLELTADVLAAEATTASLSVREHEQPLTTRHVQLAAGEQRITIPCPLSGPGVVHYVVHVAAAHDTDPGNNTLAAATYVGPPHRVGVIEDDPDHPAARALGALVGEAADVIPLATDAALESLLKNLDLLVLPDTPAGAIPAVVQTAVRDAVTEGLGLLVTGGRRSYGAGGYADTALAEVLPVTFPQEAEHRDPSTTLVIIIDTSGSMGGTRVNLAKEIARLAIARLKPHDKVGIVEFYGSKRWAAPIQPASNAIDIQRGLNRLSAGGGTIILPAIEEAYYALRNVRTRTRHVLVLTDGGVETGAFEPLIRKMADEGITLSTVLVGPGGHSSFLASLAHWGGGRFYSAPDRFNLPEVVVKQPSSSLITPVVEQAARLVAPRRDALLGDLDFERAPAILGYNHTKARRTADVVLATEGGHPVLVRWQYGLGTVVAFTSQIAGEWTAELAQWPPYAELLSNVVRSAARPGREYALRIMPVHRPGALEVDITARRREVASATALELTVRVDADPARRRILDPIAAGRWNVRFEAPRPGVWEISARTLDGDFSGAAATVVPPPREVTTLGDNAQLLKAVERWHPLALQQAAQRGTSTQPSPRECWPALTGAALVLFLLNVVVRRWPARRPAPETTAALAVLLLMLGVGQVTRAAEPPASPPATPAVEAQAAEQTGDESRALRLLEDALSAATDEAERFALHIRQALLLYDREQTEAGRAALRAAAATGVTGAGVFCAHLASLLADWDLAVVVFPSDDADLPCFQRHMFRGHWLLRAGRADAAEDEFRAAQVCAALTRDRRYALEQEAAAARAAGHLAELADRWLSEPTLAAERVEVLVSILRELRRPDEALRVLQRAAPAAGTADFAELQREVIAVALESAQEQAAEVAYRELLARQPEQVEWVSGLARLLLLQDRRADAVRAFGEFAEHCRDAGQLLLMAEAAAQLALDEVALAAAHEAVRIDEQLRVRAILFEADLARRRGNADYALSLLNALTPDLAEDHEGLRRVAEAYERYGDKAQALRLLRHLYAETQAEDVLLRVAWLLEENGLLDEAYALWKDLWQSTTVAARLRQAQERLLDLAARTGRLADLAIELEEQLDRDAAPSRALALLVELYTTANDPVSAAEILQEWGRRSGNQVAALQQLVRVYQSCEQFGRCAAVLEQLVQLDPANAVDYLQQIAILAIERRQPEQAVAALERLRALAGGDTNADEIAAGVLGLADLPAEAAASYEALLARHPERIEAYLLWGNAMQAAGRRKSALVRFARLLDESPEDDLFTVAVDGLLNLEAPPAMLRFALRRVYTRIAAQPGKVFLYRLAADLLEALRDTAGQRRVLEQCLVVAGEQRSQLLRELMESARAEGRTREVIAYGRTLLALGEELPPQVFLDLGQAFLAEEQFTDAERAFDRAAAGADYVAIRQRVAAHYEEAGRPEIADRVIRELLITDPDNVPLLLQAATLAERLDHFDRAGRQYRRAVDLLLARLPAVVRGEPASAAAETASAARGRPRGAANVDEVTQFLDNATRGLLACAASSSPAGELAADVLAQARAALRALRAEGALADVIAAHPRLENLARLVRRVAFALHMPDAADDLDRELLALFPEDRRLREEAVQTRAAWGLLSRAAALAGADAERLLPEYRAQQCLRDPGALRAFLDAGEVEAALVVRLAPTLLMTGRTDEARRLLSVARLADGSKAGATIPTLMSVALAVDDSGALRMWARQWAEMATRPGATSPETEAAACVRSVWNHLSVEDRAALIHRLGRLAEAAGPRARTAIELIRLRLATELGTPLADGEHIVQDVAAAPTLSAEDAVWVLGRAAVEERPALLRHMVTARPANAVRGFLMDLLATPELELDAALADELVSLFCAAPPEKAEAGRTYAVLNRSAWVRGAGRDAAVSPVRADVLRRVSECLLSEAEDVPAVRATAGLALRYAEGPAVAWPHLRAALDGLLDVANPEAETARVLSDLVQAASAAEREQMLALVEDHERLGGRTPATLLARGLLMEAADRPEEAMAAFEAAFAAAPDNRAISRRLIQSFEAAGRVADLARRLASGLTKSTPTESFEWRTLARLYQELYCPRLALKAARKDETPLAPVTLLKIHHLAGDTEQVRSTLRAFVAAGRAADRYWDPLWPADPSPAGWLGYMRDEQTPAVRRPRAFAGLSDMPFAEREYQALLRTALPGQRDVGGICEGLVAAARRNGTEAALAARLVESFGRSANTVVDRQLLLALAGAAGRETGVAATTMTSGPEHDLTPLLNEALLEADPNDLDVLTTLARAAQNVGDLQRARDILRWTVARDALAGAAPSVERRLERLDLYLDTVPAAARSDERARWLGGLTRTPLERPGDALIAARLALTEVEGGSPTPDLIAQARQLVAARPGTYLKTAAALARADAGAGRWTDFDQTAAQLLDPGLRVDLRVLDVRGLLPAGDAPLIEQTVRRVARLVLESHRNSLFGRAVATRTLCLLAGECAERGLTGVAGELIAGLPMPEDTAGEHWLWVADVCRRVGEETRAWELERALLEADRLPIVRVPSVLEEWERRIGQDEADRMAVRVAEYSDHPIILLRAIRAARAAGDDSALRVYQERLDAWSADALGKFGADRIE